MAQKVIRTEYSDGKVVLSNIRNNKGFPVFRENDTVTATKVTQWYDGSVMSPDKADGKVYLRYKSTGEYFLVNLPNWGETFLEKDTMQQMRDMSLTEILLLKAGYYKGVKLNRYYAKNDAPEIQYFLSTTSVIDDGGSVIVVGDIKLEHKFTGQLDIRNFGAKATNSDNLDIIQTVFDYCHGKGLEVIVPKDPNGDFLISNAVSVGSKTTLTFLGSFFKLSKYSTIGTVIFTKQGVGTTENIIINNPLVDGSNIIGSGGEGGTGGTGENGISGANVRHMRVYGGIIKNCKKGNIVNKLGGKGFQFESVNVEDVIVDGTRIENCSWGISTQYDISANDALGGTRVECSFNNLYIKDCQNVAILHQMNGLEDSDKHIVSINNLTIENCGDDDGLFVVSRLKNAKVNNITVIGNPITGSFIRGRHSFSEFKNIKIMQNMTALIDNRPSFHGNATRESINNNYEFKLDSDVSYILTSSADSSYANRELKNSNIIVNTSKDNFSFSLPQAAWATTNINILSPTKTILVNTTEAVSKSKNTSSAYNQLISLGTGRKIKSGTSIPNGNVLGDVGDIYLHEINGYANVYFKYFGASTNTGWNNLLPALSGTTALRPSVVQTPIGGIYWNTTNKRLEVNDGTTWLDIFAPASASNYGMVKQATAQANISQADLVAIATADGTDAATTQDLANAIKSWINTNLVPLVNATKASQNTELTNQRTAGQQSV